MEWSSDTTADRSDNAASTEGSVNKPPSRLGLVAGIAALVVVAAMAIFGTFGGQSAEDVAAESESGPMSTAMTLMNGADTISGSQTAVVPTAAATEPMPDRGAFREIYTAQLVASCDHLVDGPEPISAGLYRQHGRCLNEAFENVDERCRMAAAFFYVMPGEAALDVACDIGGEKSPRFRESVQQSMVLECDNARDARVDPTHEAYYEYDRCLQMIEAQLDATCYLVARAQFMHQVETQIRDACEIDDDVDLTRITG